MGFPVIKDAEFQKLRDNESLRLLQKGLARSRINKALDEKNIKICPFHCAESLIYVLYKFKKFFQECDSELSYNTQFIFTHEQEVTEERKQQLQDQLSKLKTNEAKISFLINEKANYLQNISPRTLEVSGSVHADFPPGAELFFDRYIQIEIERLDNLIKSSSNIEKQKQPMEYLSELLKTNFYLTFEMDLMSIHKVFISEFGKQKAAENKIATTQVNILDHLKRLTPEEKNTFIAGLKSDLESELVFKDDSKFCKLFAYQFQQYKLFVLSLGNEAHSKSKENYKPNASVIRLFCALVHQSTEMKRGFDEDAESYCKRVCKKFNLLYPGNARKLFNQESEIKKTDKSLKKIIDLILPNIEGETKRKIEAYIHNKTKMSN